MRRHLAARWFVVAGIAVACTDRDDQRGVDIYKGDAAASTSCLVMSRDGVVRMRGQVLAKGFPPSRAIADCSSIGVDDGLYTFYRPSANTALEIVQVAGPVDRFIGDGYVKRADGSVLSFARTSESSTAVEEWPALQGVEACAGGYCTRAGELFRIEIGDLPGEKQRRTLTPVAMPERPIDIQAGSRGPHVLTGDGHVFTIAGVPPALSRIDGFPLITRLHPGFVEDGSGRVWYDGFVQTPYAHWGLPRHLLPTTALLRDCPDISEASKVFPSCVDPVEIPTLRHTQPHLDYSEVLAIMSDGEVRCWCAPASDGGCRPF